MGTITERTKVDGKSSFTAQIRKKKNRKIAVNLVETFPTRKAAENWIRRQEARLENPAAIEQIVHQHQRKTFREVIIAYSSASNGAWGSTKTQVLSSLCRMEFGEEIAADLTAHDFSKLATDLAKGVQPDPKDPQKANPDHYTFKPRAAFTVMSYMVTVGTVMRYGGVFADVTLPLEEYEQAMRSLRHTKIIKKSGKRDRRPSLVELDLLMEHFYDRYQSNPRCVPMHKIVAAAIFKSHRQGELMRDKWQNFDADKDMLTIQNMKHPRETEGNNVEVMIRQEARDIVNSMPRVSEFVFPYHKDTVSSLFTEACKLLGIENLHFHDLRHDGISRLFEMGLDVPIVAKHTGHKSWQTLERYTHISKCGDKYENWKWWDIVKAPL